MSPDNLIPGWNATDDEVVVPVRDSSATVQPSQYAGPAADIAPTSADHIVLRHAAQTVNPMTMRFSAILGVILVLGAIGLHFGFGNIFGDLIIGTDVANTTIEITEDGAFFPDSITLHPGDTLNIINHNVDPQVIKSKGDTELFPVQVLFDTSFEFTVPDTANGTYTYFSETLPDDKTLTIIVTPGESPTVETTPTPSQEDFNEIPLPFVDDAPDTIPVPDISSSSSSQSSAAATVSIQNTEHSSETATISLRESQTASSEASENDTPSNLPVNPYTVSSGLEQQSRIQAITEAARQAQELHSGAPLQEMVKHKPTTVTKTGPEGALVLLLPALFAVLIINRKLLFS